MPGMRTGNIGVILCGVYGVMFAGFLLLTVFEPRVMGSTSIPIGGDFILSLFGSDVAVAYGMLLICAGIFFTMVFVRMAE